MPTDDPNYINWSLVPECLQGAKIIGQNRVENSYGTETTKWLEFSIFQEVIPVEYAEQLLDLLLIGLLNETVSENNETLLIEGQIYNCSSVKLDGYNPVLMNLPGDILSIIPSENTQYVNGPVEDHLRFASELPIKKLVTLPDWVKDMPRLFQTIYFVVVYTFMCWNLFLGLRWDELALYNPLFKFLYDLLKFLCMLIFDFIMDILEDLAKAAMLALIYATVALILAGLTSTYSAIIPILNSLPNIECGYSL